ncbi:MAG: SMC-Scp complex subunit ScpB [Candidatus Omnitrophica bacterium]|nr:SMC-Scp complex subunit ScpB [Candidatus Omnitrophota bacterium]
MNVKSIIESLLLINEKPIALNELNKVIDTEKPELETALEELAGEYDRRKSGICIVKVAGGYQMCSRPENDPWLKKMFRERGKQKLSTAALETLAIIAYKQPITRMEIEAIRGVNIDGVVRHLFNLGLVKTSGRKEVVGRPFLYVTTRKFLEYFGLNSLRDLPKLEEFASLAESDSIVQEMVQQNEEETPGEEARSEPSSPEPVAVPESEQSNEKDTHKKEDK